jgi:hypothetical protein
MAHSSILGADVAPSQPICRGSDLLGPSDSSDSGSDALGTEELHGDSDAAGTGERGSVVGADTREGGDILPDRVTRLPDGEDSEEPGPETDQLTGLDAENTINVESDEDR